jgi:hypothetical protein
MSYRGAPNWPPVWVGGAKTLKGEIGILKYVLMRHGPADRCYLTMEYQSQAFVGTLFFDDEASCGRICTLLQSNIGHSLKEIGDLEVLDTV